MSNIEKNCLYGIGYINNTAPRTTKDKIIRRLLLDQKKNKIKALTMNYESESERIYFSYEKVF